MESETQQLHSNMQQSIPVLYVEHTFHAVIDLCVNSEEWNLGPYSKM